MSRLPAFSEALAQFTNDMPSGVITVDRKGAVVGHNRASERIFERPLSNASLCGMVRESARLQELLDRCIGKGEVCTRVEFSVPVSSDADHPAGKRIGINLSPIRNGQNGIDGAICLLSDLTEIVELQNQIKLKENFAVLGEMSAGIAHEFKNSIATILGYAQLSNSETRVDVLQGYAREIQKESRSMSTMITDFLNFARPVDPAIVDTDIHTMLDGVIADVRNSRPGGYRITTQYPAPAIVLCDTTLMRQTFQNLLLNAVEAVADVPNDGGRISISTERVRERDAGIVRIVVEDNGHGILSGDLTKIFYPFFTTKSHGTGLGLSLVQKIVLAHNGRIEVQNAVPHGARFVVTLPVRGEVQ